MGAWGVKALQSDEGMDVLSVVEETIAGRERVTADELIEAVRGEGLLGDDPDIDEYLYDVTAIALAEILTGDTAQLVDPAFGGVVFVATPEGVAELVEWLTRIRDGDEDDREIVELWEGDEEHAAHVAARLDALAALAPDRRG